MIDLKDVTVYLKALPRIGAVEYCKKWTDACKEAGLNYVFVLRGWGNKYPEGNALEIFDFDKPSCLQNELNKIVENSPISIDWRDRAVAHCLPFWHNTRKYTINIDADDSIHDGSMSELLLSVLNAMEQHGTPVLSYDVHFSISDDRLFGIKTWPHIWCMGVCLGHTEFMKSAIITALSKPANHTWKHWYNVDLALDQYFQYELDCPISFLMKKGRYIHGPPQHETYFYYDCKRDVVIKDYRKIRRAGDGDYREVIRHPRTLVLETNEKN
jgi:hypothetical protein